MQDIKSVMKWLSYKMIKHKKLFIIVNFKPFNKIKQIGEYDDIKKLIQQLNIKNNKKYIDQ
jgi:hypothetical protein